VYYYYIQIYQKISDIYWYHFRYKWSLAVETFPVGEDGRTEEHQEKAEKECKHNLFHKE